MRTAVSPAVRSKAKSRPLPAANRGWILNENLAGSAPGGAIVMENVFPTQTGWRIRGGNEKYATISTGPVLRMWTYQKGSTKKFFASDETNIFDITSVTDTAVIPAADVTGQTSGYYSTFQMGTAGGNEYVFALNGTDAVQRYDGTSWSAPSITGVTSADLIFGWTFASRMFMIEKETLDVWFFPVDAVSGAASQFSLAGIFESGGELLFGSTWSLDAGDGLDDKCVFVSNQGEVAIYQGTDPGDANAWSKVGVYQVAKPMGANATIHAGGDLLISTEAGIVPLTEIIRKDEAALSLAAVSRNIEPEWEAQVEARGSVTWELMKWTSNNMLVSSLPITDGSDGAECLVANLETGAWCKFLGWDTRSLAHYDSGGYFGTNSGTVHKMEETGSDDGASFTCRYAGLPDHLGAMGATKIAHSVRASFLADTSFLPKISMAVNYSTDFPSAPNAVDNFPESLWDVGLWDEAIWLDLGLKLIATKWVSVGKTGFVHSPQVQITCDSSVRQQIEFVAFDVIYESGGVMV